MFYMNPHKCPECGSRNLRYSLDTLAHFDRLCLVRLQSGRMVLHRVEPDGTTTPADDKNANWNEPAWCADCTAES